MPNIVSLEKISLKNHQIINEERIKQEIIKNPSILGLGDLIVRDNERTQPRAGRLDLLLQDPDTNRRYEVEIQLGELDESHIIRTLEYWDIERRRYPQYDHCAVIIAENITSRFLNVIGLFNGNIPLIAIQMNAFKIGEDVGLACVIVLDEMSLGLADEDEEGQEPTDRHYWLNRASEATVKMADNLVKTLNELSGQEFQLNYTKFYTGLAANGRANNFIILVPLRQSLKAEIKLPQNEETQKLIDEAEFENMGYDGANQRYRLRLFESDFEHKKDTIRELLKRAYENSK